MKANEIRTKWLNFFRTKDHHIEPSASLVPHNDPSLLWINAGMAPLKPYFDGRQTPVHARIANAQKCIRTNDIENVGKTKRHHTFFEMLGNFSLGDYFKEQTISWAWEFLTDPKWIGLDPKHLYVTIHPEDNEAHQIWNKKIGVPESHIRKIEDNFWDIGEGPCGPCSEIFYDRGEAFGDDSCYPGGENERYLEIWNLVFSQYNHEKNGEYTPLPHKNIDTGAGLERLTSVLQQVDSNFDTDLFIPIIEKVCEFAHTSYGKNVDTDTALKVIADHARAVVFSVGDGVLPSNEGRGYVIRRLIRRAVSYGRRLGIESPFVHMLTPIVGMIMGEYYPEIVMQANFITKVILNEEQRFHETLTDGLGILEQLTAQAKKEGRTSITGEQAFKLYDTYGFPVDLTQEVLQEQGLEVDFEGFEMEMNKQRDRARAARQETQSMQVQGGILSELDVHSEYIGYDTMKIPTQVRALIVDNELKERVEAGQTCQVILENTPFYAESGGQVSDKGRIYQENQVEAKVKQVFKAPNGQHIHVVEILLGSLKVDHPIQAEVDCQERIDIERNHTATHILHQALRDVLGDHVNQAGSLVESSRLRFDFSHISSLTDDEIRQVEDIVNEKIFARICVSTQIHTLEDAQKMGAKALFGEKYQERVRVVSIGNYSMELCGGCHVRNTGAIDIFKIYQETGIGSGIRRIEATTGRYAYQYIQEKLNELKQAAAVLKVKESELPTKLEHFIQSNRQLEAAYAKTRIKLESIHANELLGKIEMIGEIPLLRVLVQSESMEFLREFVDILKQKEDRAILVLGARLDKKAGLLVYVPKEWIEKGLHAGNIVKELARICEGGGGGRPDLAQAGGKNPDKLPQALAHVDQLLLERKH